MKARVRLACVFAVALSTTLAFADDTRTAAEHFREGQRAFEAHDYRRAATEFEAANHAKPAAAALLGAGLAWELAGELVNAANDLAAALDAGGLEPRDEATARTHLLDLDAKVAHLEVRGETTAHVTIDGRDLGALPLEARVVPGDHAVELEMTSGAKLRRVVTVGPGLTFRVDMTQPSAPAEPPPPADAPSSLQRTLGYAGIGVGAATFVAGIVVGAFGLSTRDEFVSDGRTSVALHDRAITLRTVANVLLATGAVLGITGIVLVFTAPKKNAVSVALGPTSASLRVTF